MAPYGIHHTHFTDYRTVDLIAIIYYTGMCVCVHIWINLEIAQQYMYMCVLQIFVDSLVYYLIAIIYFEITCEIFGDIKWIKILKMKKSIGIHSFARTVYLLCIYTHIWEILRIWKMKFFSHLFDIPFSLFPAMSSLAYNSGSMN